MKRRKHQEEVGLTQSSFLRLLLVTIALTLAPLRPALAHSRSAMDEWVQAWVARAEVSLSPTLLADWRDMQARHQPLQLPAQMASVGGDDWRGLVASHFPAGVVDTMVCLISHESGGNPAAVNPTSGATGLLQVMPFWHQEWPGDYTDPAWNIEIARRIYNLQGLSAWSPYNRGLCRG